MRNVDDGKAEHAQHSEASEGDRFTQMLDGLLAVPHSEINQALEQEKAKKKKGKKPK
jgi:hypothetical protein